MELNIDGIKPPYPSEKLRDKRIFLASNSPRRRELLAMIVPDFTVLRGKNVDETYDAAMPASIVPEFLSKIKSEAYADDMHSDDVIITADTVVIVDDEILGKPADPEQACAMLHKLSGRTHVVITGVTVVWKDGDVKKSESFSERTEVNFGTISDEEIREYVSRYSPLDKAGAYGIQEWTGAAISRIDGCFYNVMGLPIHKLYQILKRI